MVKQSFFGLPGQYGRCVTRVNRFTKTCNERPRLSTVALDKNGNLLNGKDGVYSRRTEHFKEVLYREEPENQISSLMKYLRRSQSVSQC